MGMHSKEMTSRQLHSPEASNAPEDMTKARAGFTLHLGEWAKADALQAMAACTMLAGRQSWAEAVASQLRIPEMIVEGSVNAALLRLQGSSGPRNGWKGKEAP